MLPVWQLRDTFLVDDEGRLIWRTGVRAGREAGYTGRLGYRRVEALGERMETSRVIWAITHGAWPEHWIDHIDGNPANNRPANLRQATPGENSRNRKTPSSNTSGVKGVSWEKNRQKWQVLIRLNGRKRFVGYAPDLERGAAMYAEAAKRLHGEFACLTR